MESQPRKICCICKMQTNEVIMPFDENKIQKFYTNLECRLRHNLKYADCEIPQEKSDTIGYHSSCGSRFNAIKKQFKMELPPPNEKYTFFIFDKAIYDEFYKNSYPNESQKLANRFFKHLSAANIFFYIK